MTFNRPYAAALFFFGTTALVYVLSGAVTATSVGGWYATLAKPSFNPPDWLFTPVWTVLYIMMALAAWLAWRAAAPDRRRPVVLAHTVQIVLNCAWTVLFFGLHVPGLAFVELLALLAAIGCAAVIYRRSSVAAALLMVPYLLWTGFAAALNGSIWLLN